jgi:hypothetical protein
MGYKIDDVLFRCNQTPGHPILYGRECDYLEENDPDHTDPCCPMCGHVMVRINDSDIEPLIANRDMYNAGNQGQLPQGENHE